MHLETLISHQKIEVKRKKKHMANLVRDNKVSQESADIDIEKTKAILCVLTQLKGLVE